MRLLRFQKDSEICIGAIFDNQIVDVAHACRIAKIPTPISVLATLEDQLCRAAILSAFATQSEAIIKTEVKLLAPIERPGKIFALAANYEAHAYEVGLKARDKKTYVPKVFPKLSSSLVGPHENIEIPSVSDMVDYEVEIAVVIGTRADRVLEKDAIDYVAGWMAFNDVTARRMTFPGNPIFTSEDESWHFLYGKWCNGFSIAGPWLVSRDEIPDPNNLTMELSVNGEIRQSALVGDMTFTITEAISFISSICVLEPGDVISMGTPAGIGEMGAGCLAVGDLVELSIESLGSQSSRVVRQKILESA